MLLFLAWHLADLTWVGQPDFVRGEVYRNVDASLSRWPVALLYIVANIALGIHLFHGAWSLFQSMGWSNPGSTCGGDISPPPSPSWSSATSRSPSPCSRASSRSEGAHPDERQPRSKVPAGPIADKWESYKFNAKLVNPNNKRKFKIIVVGTGLAGRVSGGDARRARLPGRRLHVPRFVPAGPLDRRAGRHQAAKNYRGDGDSIDRLFYDTVKGGDFRSREANVYRLAETSVNIIDQMVAQGVPFAREYGGLLDNARSAVRRCRARSTPVARRASSCCSAPTRHWRQVGLGTVRLSIAPSSSTSS